MYIYFVFDYALYADRLVIREGELTFKYERRAWRMTTLVVISLALAQPNRLQNPTCFASKQKKQ